MDEVFVAVSGSRAVAEDMKSEIVTYLRKSLYLEVTVFCLWKGI